MRLKYLSNATVDQLKSNVSSNVQRYKSGSFADLMADGEWDIELTFDADLGPLDELDPSITPEAEIENSRLVWRALGRLPPSVAYEEGIWTRLTHVECLRFSRSRWIKTEASDEEIQRSVKTHFFAEKMTRRRDDNAISRLWWNAYIARSLSADDSLGALPLLLKTADIRSNIIERRRTGSRPKLASGLIRFMATRPEVTSTEARFRQFMKSVNKFGGGVLFEALTDADVDAFLTKAYVRSAL